MSVIFHTITAKVQALHFRLQAHVGGVTNLPKFYDDYPNLWEMKKFAFLIK
jgi:hypothetical protein